MTTSTDRRPHVAATVLGTPFQELDVEFEGTTVHCYEAGEGRPVVLLHGSGAGAATLSNYRRIMGPLSTSHRVVAADLVGFGKSGLKPTPPYFDMDLWVRQACFLLDRVGPGAICVGHSLSGPIVLKTASVDPRVAAVVTTATMGWTIDERRGPRWRFPESRDEVRAAIARTFFDPSHVEESEVERRMAVLERPGYREYFEAMFAGDGHRYVVESSLAEEELERITCPVALLHGMADRSFDAEDTSIPIARRLNIADVHVFAACAHSVAFERPADVLSIIDLLEAALDRDEVGGGGVAR